MREDITLNRITKIEGHASLVLKIENGIVEKCELQVLEGSRYFEALLKGKKYNEAHEVSSRICGICSCAHTLCAIQAVERALSIVPSGQTLMLRKLMTIGERIRSHAAHLYFLSLPDYLGFDSTLDMAAEKRELVDRALRLMEFGNLMVKNIGGRDIHPVSATVGGFLRLPEESELQKIVAGIKSMKGDAMKTARLFGGLRYPDFERKTEYFSLFRKGEYAILYGDIKSDEKIFPQTEYESFINEYHVPYSTANFAVKKGLDYIVGALARMNNNHQWICRDAKRVIRQSGYRFPSDNPFLNNFAQALEIMHHLELAEKIIRNLDIVREPLKTSAGKSGRGIAAIEVPRGTLWHDYTLRNGIIEKANIITPTAQNLNNMETDIKAYVGRLLEDGASKEEIVREVEKLIRAYDPCFSCSTHFLEVKWL